MALKFFPDIIIFTVLKYIQVRMKLTGKWAIIQEAVTCSDKKPMQINAAKNHSQFLVIPILHKPLMS